MRKLLSALAIAGIASSAGFTFSEASAQSREVTLLKNPGCQCCDGYADYLRHNGFSVTVKATHDLAQMSRAAGIPDDFQGCHLRSEEHTSELQPLMRISYAVFCLKKNNY